MSHRIILLVTILVLLCFGTPEAFAQDEEDLTEWNHRIRREKFDIVLPEVMRRNNVDMWIHVMRETIEDPFGAEDLGATSGVFVFTDRGTDRIERAVLGRRWGDSQAGETWRVTWDTRRIEESGAYDIIHDPIHVLQPPGGPETEYDYRYEGLREGCNSHTDTDHCQLRIGTTLSRAVTSAL